MRALVRLTATILATGSLVGAVGPVSAAHAAPPSPQVVAPLAPSGWTGLPIDLPDVGVWDLVLGILPQQVGSLPVTLQARV